ncbi:HepT-like ribonuclease domain-containing protein [Rhodohalobacter sp. 8-1]|uniref:HepT-like ribonuclease domain-containing protein n=1 Tax=Rhodohalobacter sp. 8-1 TaxID=3131972 RepID=UPI0030ECED18
MKSDKVYVLHIIDSIDQIVEYTDQIHRDEFKENRLIQDAVVRNFEIIGEAAKNISNRTREKYSYIPWEQMAGMRDKLIRNYMSVDLNAVWNTIE